MIKYMSVELAINVEEPRKKTSCYKTAESL